MKKISISNRAKSAPDSPIRKLVPFAKQAEKNGIKVHYLNIGQPDLKIPPLVKSDLKKCVKFDFLPYANSQGIPSLLNAWQKYLKSIDINISENELLITSGASEALILTLAAICDPSDEILAFEPFYANYLGFSNLISAKIIPVTLSSSNNYHLPKISEISKKITSKTKAIFFTNPNNPTGTVYTKKELQNILEIAKKHNLFIISDETYFGLNFDKTKSLSLLHVASKADQDKIIIIDSLSKRLNICGARIGVIISKNTEFMTAINRFAQARLSVATIDQKIVANALIQSKTYTKKVAKIYQKRRDIMIKTLEKELSIKINIPEGAFYAMISLPIKNSDHFAKWLLTDFSYKNQTVMVAPGSGFYASKNMGNNEIRIAYVLDKKELKNAIEILSIAIKKYQELFV